MRAVKERQFLVLPFAASDIGVRLGATVYSMAEATVALARGKALNSLEFTQNDEESAAVPCKVVSRFPTWNGTDLENLCPGSTVNIEIRPVSEKEERGLVDNNDGGRSNLGLSPFVLAV